MYRAWIVIASLLALTVGALVPRIAYRMSVPFGDRCRTGCHQCDEPFKQGIRGWTHFGSKCRSCHAKLGPAAGWTALTAGIAAAGLAAAISAWPLSPVFTVVALIGVLLAAIDIACMRLPDVLVLPTVAFVAVALAIVAVVRDDSAQLVRAVLAALVLSGAYFVLAVITRGGVGLGDVKLSLVLGLLLGWFGWAFVVAGALIAHLLHGAIAGFALATRRADKRTFIPMGPALLGGAWCAVAVLPVALSLLA